MNIIFTKKNIIILIILVGFISGIIYKDKLDILLIKNYISNLGVFGPMIFMLLYILFTIFLWPGAILTLLGGMIFGYWGILINLISATIGATCAYIIAKYIAHEKINNFITKNNNKNHKLVKVINIINNNGWQVLAILRLIPIVPFNLLNYLVGLTNISLGAYILTSIIFMFPGAVLYTYIGILGDLAIQGDTYQLIKGIIITISIFLALLLTIRVIKYLRSEDIKELEDK